MSTLARIGRIGPAFGVGGVANRSLRDDWIAALDSYDSALAAVKVSAGGH